PDGQELAPRLEAAGHHLPQGPAGRLVLQELRGRAELDRVLDRPRPLRDVDVIQLAFLPRGPRGAVDRTHGWPLVRLVTAGGAPPAIGPTWQSGVAGARGIDNNFETGSERIFILISRR